MTIAERLEQRGEAQALLDQMGYKFDAVPESYRDRVTKADGQHLRLWLRNILKANTLDEVFT
ncbi:hypothetical protein ABTE00_21170, partial [Acinetobacter baumannii]